MTEKRYDYKIAAGMTLAQLEINFVRHVQQGWEPQNTDTGPTVAEVLAERYVPKTAKQSHVLGAIATVSMRKEIPPEELQRRIEAQEKGHE